MANIKISELPAASAASASQEFETNDSGTSKKVTGGQLKSFVKSDLAVADVTDLTATAAELNVLDGITGMASQAEAEAGTNNTALMTPLRVSQAIDANTAPSGVLTFTASGAITAGDIVAINSDGTVSKTGTKTSPSFPQYSYSATQRQTATQHEYALNGDWTNKEVGGNGLALSDTTFVSFHDNVAATSCIARINTVQPDGTVSFGANQTIVASGFSSYSGWFVKASSNSFAVIYSTAATNTYIIIGQVSGSTITVGSPTLLQSGLTQSISSIMSDNNGKIIIAGNTSQTNAPLRVIGVSVSGTTATAGGWTVLRNTAPSYQQPKLAYDPVGNVFLLNAVQITTPWTNWSWAISISGTTLSIGSQQNVFGNQPQYYGSCDVIYHPGISRFVANNPQQTISPPTSRFYTATITSLTITASAQVTDVSILDPNFKLAPDGTLLTGVGSQIWYSMSFDALNSYKPSITELPYLLATSYFNNYGLLNGSGLYFYSTVVSNSSAIFDQYVYIAGFSGIKKTIGSANQTVLDGQPVQVAVAGGIGTGFSGLSSSERQYLRPSGTLSSTSGAAFFGTALSPTSVLLTPERA